MPVSLSEPQTLDLLPVSESLCDTRQFSHVCFNVDFEF